MFALAHQRVDGKDKRFALQFYGTQGFAALPILLYMVIAAVISIGIRYYGMEALIFASVIGLLAGFFLCRNKLFPSIDEKQGIFLIVWAYRPELSSRPHSHHNLGSLTSKFLLMLTLMTA